MVDGTSRLQQADVRVTGAQKIANSSWLKPAAALALPSGAAYANHGAAALHAPLQQQQAKIFLTGFLLTLSTAASCSQSRRLKLSKTLLLTFPLLASQSRLTLTRAVGGLDLTDPAWRQTAAQNLP